MIFNLCKAIKISKKNQLLRTCILCLAFITMIASGVVGTISVIHNDNVNAATIATPTNGHAQGKSTAYAISNEAMALPIAPGYIYMTPVASDKVVNLATIIAAQDGNGSVKKAYIEPDVKMTVFTPTSSQSKNGAKKVTISTYFQYERNYESLMKTQEAMSYIPQTTDSLIFLSKATWDGDKNNSYTHLRDSNHKVIKGEWYVYSSSAGTTTYSKNTPDLKKVLVTKDGKNVLSEAGKNVIVSQTPKDSTSEIDDIAKIAYAGGVYMPAIAKQMVTYQKGLSDDEKNSYAVHRYNYDYGYFSTLTETELKKLIKSSVYKTEEVNGKKKTVLNANFARPVWAFRLKRCEHVGPPVWYYYLGGVCTTANISRFQWQGLKPAPMRPIDPRIYLQLRVIKQAMT